MDGIYKTDPSLLAADASFRYRMLDRMRSDCEYYLGYGNRQPKNLWAGNEVAQIANMKALWNSFSEKDKPEWLSYEKIESYEKEMCPNAILVERDYKGVYERFALTPEEFSSQFPDLSKKSLPAVEAKTYTISPLVHIWFEPCVVGDAAWQRHFTDMKWGIPDSDITAGNLAYIREDMCGELQKYVPEQPANAHPAITVPQQEALKPTLTTQILSAESRNSGSSVGKIAVQKEKDR